MKPHPISPATAPASGAVKPVLEPELMLECRHIGKIYSQGPEAVKVLEDLGIVTEMTGQKKNRSYSYQTYVELLSR